MENKSQKRRHQHPPLKLEEKGDKKNKNRKKQKQPANLQTKFQTETKRNITQPCWNTGKRSRVGVFKECPHEMNASQHPNENTKNRWHPQTRMQNTYFWLFLDQIYEENNMKTANSLRCNGISNGKLFGFFTVVITSKACDSPALLYNTLLQHISTGFFSKTSVQPVSTTLFCDISPTLLYNTLLQHIPTMQQSSPTILSNARALTYITLFPNTYLQGSSPTLLYNIRLRHISTTLLYNTLLQHSSAGFFSKTSVQPVSTTLFCDISPMLLYNTLLQHIPTMQQSSPTVLCNALALIYITLFPNTYLQGSSPTLLYNLSLQHASPTLFLHETAFRCSNFVGNYYGSTNQVWEIKYEWMRLHIKCLKSADICQT